MPLTKSSTPSHTTRPTVISTPPRTFVFTSSRCATPTTEIPDPLSHPSTSRPTLTVEQLGRHRGNASDMKAKPQRACASPPRFLALPTPSSSRANSLCGTPIKLPDSYNWGLPTPPITPPTHTHYTLSWLPVTPEEEEEFLFSDSDVLRTEEPNCSSNDNVDNQSTSEDIQCGPTASNLFLNVPPSTDSCCVGSPTRTLSSADTSESVTRLVPRRRRHCVFPELMQAQERKLSLDELCVGFRGTQLREVDIFGPSSKGVTLRGSESLNVAKVKTGEQDCR